MEINVWIVISMIVGLELCLPTILCFVLKNNQKAFKITMACLSAVFFVLLFVGTTAEVTLKQNTVAVCYKTTELWFDFGITFGNTDITNIAVNLLLLFPVGYIVFTFSGKNYFFKCTAMALIISLIIETYQWVLPFPRSTEVIDIILNTASGIIGYAYSKLLLHFGAFKPKK